MLTDLVIRDLKIRRRSARRRQPEMNGHHFFALRMTKVRVDVVLTGRRGRESVFGVVVDLRKYFLKFLDSKLLFSRILSGDSTESVQVSCLHICSLKYMFYAELNHVRGAARTGTARSAQRKVSSASLRPGFIYFVLYELGFCRRNYQQNIDLLCLSSPQSSSLFGMNLFSIVSRKFRSVTYLGCTVILIYKKPQGNLYLQCMQG